MKEEPIEIQKLRSRFEEIKKKMSDKRKKDYDTKIAELKSININSKINIAIVTGDPKDIDKVNKLLDDIENEINNSKENEFHESNSLIRITTTINEVYDLMGKKKIEEARKAYRQIQGMYTHLTKADKKKVLDKCAELGKKLKD